jgi:hypothetical protein
MTIKITRWSDGLTTLQFGWDFTVSQLDRPQAHHHWNAAGGYERHGHGRDYLTDAKMTYRPPRRLEEQPVATNDRAWIPGTVDEQERHPNGPA